MKKILLSTLALAVVAMGFISCGDDDDARTNTDASLPVTGTYTSIEMVAADPTAPLTCNEGDVTITVTKVDIENTRADEVKISGQVTNSSTGATRTLEASYVLNAAKGNDGYLMVSSSSSALVNCRVNDDIIRCSIKLLPSGKVNNAGKWYTIVAKKNTTE